MSVQQEPDRQRSRRRPLVTLLIALGAAWLIQATCLRAFAIPTASMAPALRPGDRVLAVPRPTAGEPRRGEVWVYRDPQSGRHFVKRVVGLPGETLRVEGGSVFVNGKPLVEPYLEARPSYRVEPVRLGPGEYFVLGDARDTSMDSHVTGPVSRDRFVGRVEFRYWPPARAGGL